MLDGTGTLGYKFTPLRRKGALIRKIPEAKKLKKEIDMQGSDG